MKKAEGRKCLLLKSTCRKSDSKCWVKARVYQAWEPEKDEFSRQRSSRLIKVDNTRAREDKDEI